jgi:hypothetical protein
MHFSEKENEGLKGDDLNAVAFVRPIAVAQSESSSGTSSALFVQKFGEIVDVLLWY